MKKGLFKLFTTWILVVAIVLIALPYDTFAMTVSDNSVSNNEIENTVSDKINYLYLENKYIEAPGEQNVLVSYGDETTHIVGATLQVKNYRSEEIIEIDSADCLDNTVLFSKEFGVQQAGIYEVVAVSIETKDEKPVTIPLKETGMAAVYFGVNEEVVETEEAVSLQVVNMETDGNAAEAGKITDALEEAEYDPQLGRAIRTESSGKVVIVIDPGHDAKHVGASANGLREEQLTLKIAKYCKEELEQYQGVEVYMTRTGSACPHPGTTSTQDNKNRVLYAQSVGADAYVSIHLNAAGSSAAKGAEVFYPNANYNSSIGSEGANLALKVSRQLAALGLKNRGISIRNSGDGSRYPNGSLADYYGVIKNSKLAGFPAIIIEHAFMTNASDAAFLSNEGNLKKLGIADATGIADYYGLSKRKPVDRAKVQAYVTRLYEKCLNRAPEEAGLTDWTDKLCNYELTGASAAFGFFFSPEFTNKNVSDEEYVELLYLVMMDRGSDPAGKADWVYKLKNGVSREGVFKGFTDSKEFQNVCDIYGIEKGTFTVVQGRDRNPGLTTFVARLYTKALGREYDLEGLNSWCNRICDSEWTVLDVSTTGFFCSDEFKNKDLTDEEYVKILYNTFFDREPEPDGFNYWMKKLEDGEKREDIIAGFAYSQEFRKLMASYGL
ncbi:MAG: DUF4214 domain-containing protein [Lachnospiraceae bacterium]|nr:DUF4214 domain-containing protein [Lachnospiraceae bacterium]